eukprot:13572036-Heterocapsa_arctica.AAC.1
MAQSRETTNRILWCVQPKVQALGGVTVWRLKGPMHGRERSGPGGCGSQAQGIEHGNASNWEGRED